MDSPDSLTGEYGSAETNELAFPLPHLIPPQLELLREPERLPTSLSKTTLLIDYENVHDLPLDNLPLTWTVKVFVGNSQNSIPFHLVEKAQSFGKRLEWIKIEGNSRENLDLHLACYLGFYASLPGVDEFIVLSKDTGYDCLLKHLSEGGLKCRRVENVPEGNSRPVTVPAQQLQRIKKAASVAPLQPVKKAPSVQPVPELERVVKTLKGISKNRPASRDSLNRYVASHFKATHSTMEAILLVDELIRKKVVTVSGNKLTYHF